jgi:hypothetical protein
MKRSIAGSRFVARLEGLLVHDAKDTVPADTIPIAAHVEVNIFRRKARGIHYVKPEDEAVAHLNTLIYLTGNQGSHQVALPPSCGIISICRFSCSFSHQLNENSSG